MSVDPSTVVVAILGVTGTLLSPLMTQWVTARTKQQEFAFQRKERLDEIVENRRRAEFEERRSVYAALHTAARQYNQQLRVCVRSLEEGSIPADCHAELEKARQTYRHLYSEAQMVLPDTVSAAATTLNEGLGRAYGVIKLLETGKDQNEDGEVITIESLHEHCRSKIYDLIAELRQLMREDIGVSA